MAENIPGLGYGALRIIAECAVGIGGEPVEFVATPDPAREDYLVTWMPATNVQPSNPQSVLVPALSLGNYYPAVQVELGLAGGTIVAGQGGTALTATADAVFWSDAAVQKFVVPYAASCAAWHAAARLTDLQNAWNRFPVDQLTISALLHVVPPSNAAVALETSLAFAVKQGSAAPQAMTLSSYLGLGLGSTIEAESVIPTASFEQVAPTNPAQYPGYTVLRGLAEWATWLYDTPEFFPWTPGQTQALQPTQEQVGFGIPAYIPQVPPDRTWPTSVTFTGTDGVSYSLTDIADAVFWSQGSIQQFVLPYYASVGGFQEPGLVQGIIDAWSVDGTGADSTVVDGLVHLPNSAWVEVEETSSGETVVTSTLWESLPPQHQAQLRQYHATHVETPFSGRAHLGVLHRNLSGRHLLPLADFMVLYPHYFG